MRTTKLVACLMACRITTLQVMAMAALTPPPSCYWFFILYALAPALKSRSHSSLATTAAGAQNTTRWARIVCIFKGKCELSGPSFRMRAHASLSSSLSVSARVVPGNKHLAHGREGDSFHGTQQIKRAQNKQPNGDKTNTSDK